MKNQDSSEYTTVPILLGFNPDIEIGSLTILTKALPITPNYAFALGYKLRNTDTQEYTLMTVSPIQDSMLKLST